MIQNVFAQIDRLNDTYLNVWEDICNIESPSNDKAGVDRVSAYFREIARERGWKIEVFPQERFGDVVAITMNPDACLPPVALSGHMDTVHPVGSFGTPPCKRDQNHLYGPGAMDCKGGVVAGFLAMDALRLSGFTKRPVMMLLQSNEEIGSGLNNKEPIQLICRKAQNAVAFLNLEGHEDYFAGKACLIRKGIAGFLFTVKGIAAHSSYCAREGANAIADAAHRIIEIEKIKDDGGVTCSCNLISGGSATNTVPCECTFKVDMRFATQEQYKETMRRLQEIADTAYIPGCSCQMTQTNLRPAMELSDRNIQLLEKANALFLQNGLSTLEIGMRNGGSDAADVSLAGIPCLDSLGVGGERGHSVEERGVLSSLAESAKRIVSIICGI